MRLVGVAPLGLDMQVELADGGAGVLVAVPFPQLFQLLRSQPDAAVFAAGDFPERRGAGMFFRGNPGGMLPFFPPFCFCIWFFNPEPLRSLSGVPGLSLRPFITEFQDVGYVYRDVVFGKDKLEKPAVPACFRQSSELVRAEFQQISAHVHALSRQKAS